MLIDSFIFITSFVCLAFLCFIHGVLCYIECPSYNIKRLVLLNVTRVTFGYKNISLFKMTIEG